MSTPEIQKTRKEDKVPIKEKLALGSAGSVNIFAPQLTINLAPQIFNMAMGISPTMVSIVLGLFRLVDAFTDPLIGWLSDRFRSRWGRRRPFILFGVIGMALTMPLVFLFNPGWSHIQIMTWYFLAGSVFALFGTFFNIPFQSLGMEMTADYHERTTLAAYQSVMIKLFSIGAGWIWYLTQLPALHFGDSGTPDTLQGARTVALIICGVILIGGSMPVIFCKERYYETASKEGKTQFWKGVKGPFTNKPFRLLLLLLIAMQIPVITHPMGAYLNTYYFFDGNQMEASIVTGWNWTLAQIVAFASVPLMALFSRRMGKEKLLRIVIAANILVAIANYIVYSQSNPWMVLIPGVLYAPLITGLWMLLPSMSTDIIDHDELETGKRREGQYAAIFSWVFKFSVTLMVAISGPILDLLGFEAVLGGDQAEGVYFRMKLLVFVPPILAAAIQLWVLKYYPLTPQVMREVRAQLEERRGKISES